MALDCIATCLAQSLTGSHVVGNLGILKATKRDLRFTQARAQTSIASNQGNGRHDRVTSARQHPQALFNGGIRLGLRQDAPTAGNHRICCQNAAIYSAVQAMLNREGLCRRDAFGMRAWQLAPLNRFIKVCRLDARWRDSDLLQKGQPPRAGAGENERGPRHYLLR